MPNLFGSGIRILPACPLNRSRIQW